MGSGTLLTLTSQEAYATTQEEVDTKFSVIFHMTFWILAPGRIFKKSETKKPKTKTKLICDLHLYNSYAIFLLEQKCWRDSLLTGNILNIAVFQEKYNIDLPPNSWRYYNQFSDFGISR